MMRKNSAHIIFVSEKLNFLRSIQFPGFLLKALVAVVASVTIGTVLLLFLNARSMFVEMNIQQSESEHKVLVERLDSLNQVFEEIHVSFNDHIAQDNRERTYWQMPFIHPEIWSMGVGGNTELASYESLTSDTKKMLDDIYASLDILKGKCFLRNSSLQHIQQKVDEKTRLWAHIPSLHPVPGYEVGSGFGYRRDPINKNVIKMHWGVDIGAPKGTGIFATADGLVYKTGWSRGYGLTVDIDHGFGFRTRYAHCASILVKKGDEVKRGQLIAMVGSTGRTVAPHLHYEVHVSGVKVDPTPYIDQSDIIFD